MDISPKTALAIAEGFVGQKMVVLPPDRRKKITKNPLAKQLYATAIGYYPHASHHHRVRETGSDDYILLYCVEGKGSIVAGDREHELLPNTFFIIPRAERHQYASSDENAWSIYWVHLAGEQAPLLYARFQEIGPSVQPVPFDPVRIALFDKLILALADDLSFAALERNYVDLLQLTGSFIYRHRETAVADDDRLSRSITWLRENLDRNIQVAELAAEANYSVSRYTELFRERTGFSPIHYLVQLRIQRSCQYLYFTRMTIKEISKTTGFSDPYYFSRMFRKQLGVSPAAYRRGQRV